MSNETNLTACCNPAPGQPQLASWHRAGALQPEPQVQVRLVLSCLEMQGHSSVN